MRTTQILAQNSPRGFPKMLENINCMHFWKNCPFSRNVQRWSPRRVQCGVWSCRRL
jgi:hypothetical protein